MTKKYQFQSDAQYAIQVMASSELATLSTTQFATEVNVGDLVRFIDGVFAEVHEIRASVVGVHVHFDNGRLVSLKKYCGVLRAYDKSMATGKTRIYKKSEWQYTKENFFMILTHHDKWRFK